VLRFSCFSPAEIVVARRDERKANQSEAFDPSQLSGSTLLMASPPPPLDADKHASFACAGNYRKKSGEGRMFKALLAKFTRTLDE